MQRLPSGPTGDGQAWRNTPVGEQRSSDAHLNRIYTNIVHIKASRLLQSEAIFTAAKFPLRAGVFQGFSTFYYD